MKWLKSFCINTEGDIFGLFHASLMQRCLILAWSIRSLVISFYVWNCALILSTVRCQAHADSDKKLVGWLVCSFSPSHPFIIPWPFQGLVLLICTPTLPFAILSQKNDLFSQILDFFAYFCCVSYFSLSLCLSLSLSLSRPPFPLSTIFVPMPLNGRCWMNQHVVVGTYI